MTFEFSLLALLLLLTAFIAAGVVAGVVHTWSLRAISFDLQQRLSLVEGVLQREVKVRAGQERWKKPDKDLELLNQVQAVPVRKPNWWETAAQRIKT